MRTKAKRASYRDAIEWLALNDETLESDLEVVAGFSTTCVIADIFGKPRDEVARDVIRLRRRVEG